MQIKIIGAGLAGCEAAWALARRGIDVTLYWMMGSVAFAKTDHAVFLLMIVIAISAFFLRQSRILNLMLLGRAGTLPLGRDLMPFFRLYILVNALLVGCIVMEAGLIGFVGLVVPHVMRFFFGPLHRILLIASALAGAILMVLADIASRMLIAPQSLPVGVVTALVGVPFFAVIIYRSRNK
mgnify:CR=1 FL=1